MERISAEYLRKPEADNTISLEECESYFSPFSEYEQQSIEAEVDKDVLECFSSKDKYIYYLHLDKLRLDGKELKKYARIINGQLNKVIKQDVGNELQDKYLLIRVAIGEIVSNLRHSVPSIDLNITSIALDMSQRGKIKLIMLNPTTNTLASDTRPKIDISDQSVDTQILPEDLTEELTNGAIIMGALTKQEGFRSNYLEVKNNHGNVVARFSKLEIDLN